MENKPKHTPVIIYYQEQRALDEHGHAKRGADGKRMKELQPVGPVWRRNDGRLCVGGEMINGALCGGRGVYTADGKAAFWK